MNEITTEKRLDARTFAQALVAAGIIPPKTKSFTITAEGVGKPVVVTATYWPTPTGPLDLSAVKEFCPEPDDETP